MDACTVATDVEDAVGLACGFVAGPIDQRVNADAREGFLIVNILGRQVGDARARIDGCGRDGVDGIGQALLVWCREHEGGSDARVAQASPGGIPDKVEQDSVGEDAHDQVGVRRLGEFVNNGGVRVGQAKCRECRAGHEAWVGDADGGSNKAVVPKVVVAPECPASLVL